MGGCTLPWQQLSLPVPPPPAIGEPRKPGGAPLAKISDGRGPDEIVGTDRLTGEPHARSAVVATKDGITLNMVEASIPEAAKSILGDVLGVPYTVSDKVKGAITIHTARGVPKDALLEVFEDALRGEGAAIVVQQGTYRILPLGDAVALAPLKAGPKYRRTPGITTHVVPLQYVAAAEMERILKAVAPNANLLRTDTTRNLLVIAGTRADHDAVMDAVSVFDVDWMRGMSVGIYPLESADPEAVAQELDTIFANDRDGPGKGIVRFVPNRRLRSVLVISSRAEYLRRAQVWLRRLDLATLATVKQVYVYPVRSRTAGELARLLQRVYGSQEPFRAAVKVPVSPPPPVMPPAATVIGPGMPPVTVVPGPVPPVPPAEPAEPEAPPAAAPPAAPAVNGVGDDRVAGIGVVADETNNA